MRSAQIRVRQWFRTDPAELFARFHHPESLERIWPGRFSWIRNSPGRDPDGAGAVREMRLAGLRLREQVIRCDPPFVLEYRMVGTRFPIRHHRTLIRLSPQGAGTVMDYRVDLETWLPGLAALAPVIDRTLRDGLERLAREMDTPGIR